MKTRIPVPEGGYSLEQLCAIAIDHGVQLHIGVHKQDIAAAPPVITLQVSAMNPNGVVAFRHALNVSDPQMNLRLSALLAQHIEKLVGQRPARLQLVKG